jgi:hypothetical protein
MLIIAALLLTLSGVVLMKYLYHANDNKTEEPAPAILVGEYVPWSEVSKLFPLKAEAKVIDVYTGLSFRVQRRAGSYHADVQPLSADDTKVMKKFYDGKWSWCRKAVILELDDGYRIAASMAGMPHGQGAIQGNNFNGHFCLHFKDSKVHKTGKVDLAHQMMVWKAADRIETELANLPPEKIIAVFFTAMDQHEQSIAALILYEEGDLTWTKQDLDGVDSVRTSRIVKLNDHKYAVDLRTIYTGSKGERLSKLDLTTILTDSGWKIDSTSINQWRSGKVNSTSPPSGEVTVIEEDWETTETEI